ncbi:MAG: hypothetical protein NC409_12850 [Clostridium sp.]|nr:hypothetical protein [Clostridium sp.]
MAGVEVKRGKHLAFKIPNGKRFVRCDSLGDDYTEAAIMERICGKRIVAPKAKATAPTKPNMLIDIQSRMQKINSPGFEYWAKTFNLKEAAKTLIYLQERGLTDYEKLEKVCDAASQKFSDLSGQIKAAEQRMKDVSELQRNIGTYSKTHDVYVQYRKLTGRRRGDEFFSPCGQQQTPEAA